MTNQHDQQELVSLHQRNLELEQLLTKQIQTNSALMIELERLKQSEAIHQETKTTLQKQIQATNDLYNNAPCGYHSLDQNGIFVQVNDTELAWLGYTRNELINHKRFIDLLTPTSLKTFESSFERFKQQGFINNLEFELICSDGTILPVLLSAAAIYDAEGTYIMSRSTIFDIRERKKVNDRLKHTQKKLEEILQRRTLALNETISQLQQEQDFTHIVVENVSDGVVACDANGRLKLFNRAARTWHNCDPRSVPPEEWALLYDLYEGDGVTPLATERIPLVRAFNGEHVRQAQMAIKVPNQEPRYLLANGDPLFDSAGQKIGAVVAMHDVTERQKTEKLLRQQTLDLETALRNLQATQSQLIQSEKMSSLGQLVAGVAHEINNPVNFIYGNLSHADEYTQDLLGLISLYQKYYPEPALEIQNYLDDCDFDFLIDDLPNLLKSMRLGADRIQKIVASLRVFSRMDEAEYKEVNLHDGIDSTLMILQNRLKAKGDRPIIQVLKHYGSLPIVECYAGQLNQVFMNILSNAIDALEEYWATVQPSTQTTSQTTSDRPALDSAATTTLKPLTIAIHTKTINPETVEIRIADNGPGMTPRIQEQLFNPFYTTKPVGKGTGMGLSISYQIVTERHQGTLTCISTVDQGAEFVIQIPVRQLAQPRS